MCNGSAVVVFLICFTLISFTRLRLFFLKAMPFVLLEMFTNWLKSKENARYSLHFLLAKIRSIESQNHITFFSPSDTAASFGLLPRGAFVRQHPGAGYSTNVLRVYGSTNNASGNSSQISCKWMGIGGRTRRQCFCLLIFLFTGLMKSMDESRWDS